MRLSSSALAFALLATSLATAQAPPETKLQVVKVDPAAASRPATAGPVKDLAVLPEGFWAHGSFDDIILSNSYASFVFGAIPEDPADAYMARQGTLIDIFTSPAAPENFQLIQPTSNTSYNRSQFVTAIDYSVNALDGSATVTTLGRDSTIENVAVDTNYLMKKSWPGVQATTTYTNDSDKEIVLPILGDLVSWGGMGTFLPSKGWTPTSGEVKGAEFVFGRLFDSHIMVAAVEGLFELRHNPGVTLIVYAQNVMLKPGESKSYQRWILTGQRDPAALFGAVLQERGSRSLGVLTGRVLERVKLPDGKVHESGDVPRCEVRIEVIKRADLDRSYMTKPYLYTMTDAAGQFQIFLPPGEYYVESSDPSRAASPSPLALRVKAETITPVDHPVSRAAGIVYEIVDKASGQAIPGKISIIPLRGTQPPDIGAPGSLEAVNVSYTPTGKGEVDLAPGAYRIVASRGNEYHSLEKRVTVRGAVSETVRFELERAFETEQWISADLGVLTNQSTRSRTTPEDRVVTAAAEGVDWIVTADPERATQLQPTIEKLGLDSFVRASGGFRLTTTTDRPTGDLTLFPIELCNAGTAEDMGAILSATTPQQAVERLRKLCPDGVIMANRILTPSLGLLALQGVSFRQLVLPEEELFTDVDGISVWEGKGIGLTSQAYQTWMGLLFRGKRLTPLAHSLSAGTWNSEVGYPRVYIPSTRNNPRGLDARELAKNIKAGQVMITNGPFIDLKVDGQIGGSTPVTAKDGKVNVDLKVLSPNWANVATVTVNLNGSFARKFIIPAGVTQAKPGQVFPSSGKVEDSQFEIRLAKDSVLQVIVEGDPLLPQDPVNPHAVPVGVSGSQVPQGQITLAFSVPILIDADGDGLLQFEAGDPEAPDDGSQTVPAF
jgi:hypothetical protein